MRVVLVNPNYQFWRPGTEFLLQALGRQVPLGLLSLASYVGAHLPWVRLSVIDAGLHLLSPEETARRVESAKPELVGLTMTTVQVEQAETVARILKEAFPRVKIIVGGPHVSGTGEKVLELCEAFDAAVFGEGEETFREILEAVRSGRPLDNLTGVICRTPGGGIRRNAPREMIKELDRLPSPGWELLAGFPKAYASNIFFSPGGDMASLTTSRGCPFSCRFCDQSTFGQHFRAFSADRVVTEVCLLWEKYGVRYLMFCDDTFTLQRDRVLEICGGIAGLRRRFAWSCDANVMTVDPPLLQAMKEAGCWAISYGIESGSEKILRSIGKTIDLARAAQVIRETREAGIHAKGLFMLGTPEESWETIKETRDFISSIPFTTINLSKFTPYPGTALWAEVQGENSLDFHRLNGMNFVLPSRHLSIQEMDEGYEKILREFYHTIRSWRTHCGLALQSWEHARRFLGIIPGLVRHAINSKLRG